MREFQFQCCDAWALCQILDSCFSAYAIHQTERERGLCKIIRVFLHRKEFRLKEWSLASVRGGEKVSDMYVLIQFELRHELSALQITTCHLLTPAIHLLHPLPTTTPSPGQKKALSGSDLKKYVHAKRSATSIFTPLFVTCFHALLYVLHHHGFDSSCCLCCVNLFHADT